MKLTDIAYWKGHTTEDLHRVVERMTATSLAMWSTNEAAAIEAMEIANAAWANIVMRDGEAAPVSTGTPVANGSRLTRSTDDHSSEPLEGTRHDT